MIGRVKIALAALAGGCALSGVFAGAASAGAGWVRLCHQLRRGRAHADPSGDEHGGGADHGRLRTWEQIVMARANRVAPADPAMRIATLILAAAAVASMFAIGAAAAQATVYCVHQGGTCPDGQADDGAALQSALTAAQGSAGNTVSIGAGTYTSSSPFQYSSSLQPVTIVGAGADQTRLEVTTVVGFALFMRAPGGSSISGLTVGTHNVTQYALELAGPSAGSTTGPVATGIAANSGGLLQALGIGVDVFDGASLTDSVLDGPIENTDGDATLSGDTVSTLGSGVIAQGTLTASRLTVAATSAAEAKIGGHATIDGLLFTGLGTNGGAGAIAQDGGQLVIRSATLIAAADGTWKQAEASNSAGGTTSLAILDSIFSGFNAAPTCSAQAGASDMTFGFDDRFVFPGETCTGNGQFTPGTGNLTTDPQFVNAAAGDYHLRPTSPAIDTGQPACAAPCQSSDLDGLTRPIDGNGDGTATRDLGAYEYGRRAPSAKPTASPTTAHTGDAVTFDAVAADPDDGDALTEVWAFDDGTSASGATVTHAFTTAGSHAATVTVVDPTGLTATATVSVTVTQASAGGSGPNPPGSGGNPTAPPSAKDTTAPVITKLHLAPPTFAIAAGRTAITASTHTNHKRAKPHHKGTQITFTLSEPARVTVSLARRTSGIRVGKRCQAMSHTHRHGRACTRYLSAGTLTRKAQARGPDRIAFSGRLGARAVKLGSYRLTLTATDPFGNRSKPSAATFTVVGR